MRTRFLLPLAIGLAVVAGFIAATFWVQRGAHIELRGSVLKVRTAAMEERASVVIVDFRFVNPADYPFVVRTVDVTLEAQDGATHQGMVISEVDAKRLFDYFPILGQKFNSSLLMKDRIAPKASEDRMIAARFEIAESDLKARKKLTVRIEEVDGAVSELVE